MPKIDRASRARRSGVVITSTIALALGGAAIVAPSSAAAADVRYTDEKTPVEPKASELNSKALTCGVQLTDTVSSNSGLKYERLVPSEATKTNRNFGLQVKADTSGERTFNYLNVVDGPKNPPIPSGKVTLPPLRPGETIGQPATGTVNYVDDVPNMVIKPPARGETAREIRTTMDLTEGQVDQIANGGMTIGWAGQYNADWDANNKYFFSDSGEFLVNGVVNPWPSENADCSPITIDWADQLDTEKDNYEATVINPGVEVKVGTVSADNDSLERLRFTAKDPDGNVVPGEITRDGNDIYWTMADYIEGQPAYTQTDKLTFEMIAMPRDLEGLKQAAEENGSLPETVYNSSLTPERYRSPETIATKTFDIDDAKNHDPNYDPRQQNITSGVANNAPTEERQTRTFTNVADSNGDTLAKLVEKYNARIELDDSNVYEGWDAYFRDPDNGDYTVVVESPAGTDARPGSFAQPIVKVTYSNGTQDIIPLLVIVDPNNTQTTDVVYPPETVRGLIGEEMASEAPTLRRVIGKNQKPVTPASYAVDPATVPAGWTIEVAPDGTVTATSPSDAKAGDIARPKITATYPDGTVDEREVTFLVGDDASLNDPSYPVEVTKPGAPVTHQIQNAPEGVTFTLDNDEVDGWTYSIDPNTGAVTVTPPADAKGGDKKANTVTVTYPDGTTDVVPVDTVVAYSFAYQAEEHYPEKTGYPGEGITSQLIVDKPAEVDFAPQNPFAIVPGGGFTATGKNNEFGNPTYTVSTQNGEWTVSLDSEGNVISQIPETAKEGDTVTVPVMVTYEDNSTETVPAVITVQDNPTRQVPFGVEYKFDPALAAGTYEVEAKGAAGVEKQQRDGTWKRTAEPKNEVVRVGTKPATASKDVTWTAPIPYSTTTRPNADLAPGETKVVQQGVDGERTYTAKFTSTGDQASVVQSEDTRQAVEEIIEYGPRLDDQELVTETTRKIPFETKITYDDTLAAGTQVVDKQGVVGEEKVTSTQKLVDGKPSGDPVVETTIVTQKEDAVIRVGTKTEGSNTVEHTEPVPYETNVEYDPEMPAGTYEVVMPGKAGEKTVKVTQTIVNSEVTDTQRDEKVTTDPTTGVIKVGTKQATATDKVEWKEPIPFSTVVRPNSDLKPGEVVTVQEGANGEATYTATFTGTNGEATVKESKDRTEPTEKIVEYGPTIADQTLTTTTTNPVPFNTTFVADSTLPAGQQVVDKQGENGVDTVTATQEIKDGKPVGEPKVTTERTKEPVNAVVRVGTKTEGQAVNSVGAEIPFGVKVEFDPNMPAGTSETVTEGKPGKKTIAVTQKVTNSQPDGEATVEEKITEQPVDQVIKVGTKPSEASAQVTWTASVPFEVETRPNSELKPGEIRVVQEGVPGEKTYTADFAAKGSDAAVTPKEEQTKAPVKEIIEYGPRLEDQELVTTVTKPVPFETEIVFDDSLDSGKQEVKQEGKLGEDTETSTQKLVDGKPSGDPVVETKRTEEPVKQIIRVGSKIEGANTVEHTEPVPYETKVEYDPNLPAGTYEVVTEGKAGEKTVKVTQTIVNSQVTDTKREENVTAQPVTEVIKVGTKQATATDKVEWTEPIPFSTVVRPNPDLKPGEVKTVQEGKNGEAKYTATFEGTNGQATVTESKDRTEPTDKIVEYGPTIDDQTLTSETTRPVEFETEFIFDDTLPAGEQVVEKQGENGEEKITSTQEIKDGKPVGEPTITTEVTKPVKKAIIRVGTKAVTTTATATEVTTSAVPTTVNTTTTQQVPTTVNTTTTATSTVMPAPATTTVTEKPAPVTETVTVPFTTKTVWDPTLEPGQEVEDVAGVDGKVQVTVADGKSKVETVTNPVQRVVRVGSKPADDVEWTEETPFKVTVVLDAQLEAGKYETVQEGKPGRVIHRADGTEETTAATDHIIKVGTYKVITNPFEFTSVQPFGTTVRPNFKLEPGERKIVQEGKAGLVRYRIDIKTGEVVKLEDSAAVERIVEYGPDDSDDKAVTTVTRPVPFDTEVIEDPNLPEGTQVIAQGEVGEEVVTTVQGLKDGRPFGDPITTAKQTVAPTNAVIRVGTKKPDAPQPLPDFERIVELPFTTKIVWDPTLEPGVEVEDVKGAAGQVKIQVVNGEPTVNTVKEPVQRVVRVGSKPADDVEWTEEIPFQVQVRQNPELTRGESRVVQDGVPGLKRYVNGKGEVVTEPVDYIFEIGTKDLVAELTYSSVTLRPGQTADVEPSTGHVEGNKYRKLEWPEGWEGSVDPDTGKLRVTPPADANPGTKVKLPVEVTDADGNTSTVEMEVTVADGGAAPTPTPEDDKASSDTARRCLANAFAANSPFLWLLPLGILGAVGYGVNEAFGPQIQQLNARFDEAVRRNMPDFGVGHGVEKPEFVREIEGQVNAINQRFAPVAEQLQPVGVALGAIALLSLTGVLVAQACSEDGFDNGLTVLGSSKDDNTAESARSSKK